MTDALAADALAALDALPDERILPLPPLTAGELAVLRAAAVAVLRAAAVVTLDDLFSNGLSAQERSVLFSSRRALVSALEKLDTAQVGILGPDAPGLPRAGASHTPSPWLVDADDPAVVTDDMGVPVARIVLIGDFPGADGDADDEIREGVAGEMEANRALIVAAPELLGVCEELLSSHLLPGLQIRDRVSATVASAKGVTDAS